MVSPQFIGEISFDATGVEALGLIGAPATDGLNRSQRSAAVVAEQGVETSRSRF
jgi:hypothetical protein